ncbi:MAG: hypothetical protein U5K56_19445 [Halioglobus sp.]|nr:hypothetical protein [Halioglobus sp.]
MPNFPNPAMLDSGHVVKAYQETETSGSYHRRSLCGDPRYRELVDISTIAGMLNRNGEDIAVRIQIQESVLVQVFRFHDIGLFKLDVKSIGILKVTHFHGLKPRSKNAL